NESTVPNPQSNIQRLTPDNVQEFRTVTLNATAETGRNSGANVMVATRPGTNALHGSVYYFNRNSAFNANEWYNNAEGRARPDLKLNQYGFDVGGPTIKNKTFFFGSYQGNNIKQSSPISSFFGTPIVYSSAVRNGLFRFVRGCVNIVQGSCTLNSNGSINTGDANNFTANNRKLVDTSGNLRAAVPICSAANGLANCMDTYNRSEERRVGKVDASGARVAPTC